MAGAVVRVVGAGAGQVAGAAVQVVGAGGAGGRCRWRVRWCGW